VPGARLRLVRETTTQTSRATPTLAERVAMVRAFVDAQRVRKDYKAGWFKEVETELHQRTVEIERDLTAEIIGAHDIDAPAIEISRHR
jgi:hypothetical protein